MNKSLLPAVVYAKEGKRKESYEELEACGWSGGEVSFYMRSILWIALGVVVSCLRAEV